MSNNCSSCGCNSCRCSNISSSVFSSRGCGALRSITRASCKNNCGCNNCNNCRVPADWPGAHTCAGYPLFYTGPCGCCACGQSCGCCGNCGNCGQCGGCDNCCESCGGCQTPYASACAAEFIAAAPQSCATGGGLSFHRGGCGCDCFLECEGGVRVEKSGVYVVSYSFAAPVGDNAATSLCLTQNGRQLPASRAFVAPAVSGNTRAASGQTLVEARAGDVISLTTSCAMNISASCTEGPVAAMLIYALR